MIPSRQATHADIALRCGVSMATVSKVLGGRPGVGPAKRQEVLEAARELGYIPRRKQLDKEVPVIGIAMRGIDNPWAPRIIAGAEREAGNAGAALMISADDSPGISSWDLLRRLQKTRLNGLVLALSQLGADSQQEIANMAVPCVVVDPVDDATVDLPVVASTNLEGARTAVDHLVELGHERIAIIGGPEGIELSHQRMDGYRLGLDRAGIGVRAEYIVLAEYDRSSAEEAALRLLSLPNPPTGIFASSDIQACGVYRAAHRIGMRIPEDLSLVGFDDSYLCSWMVPGLTTIRQPLEDMSAQATRIVLAMIQQTTPLSTRLLMPTSLVIRESTAPPKNTK